MGHRHLLLIHFVKSPASFPPLPQPGAACYVPSEGSQRISTGKRGEERDSSRKQYPNLAFSS